MTVSQTVTRVSEFMSMLVCLRKFVFAHRQRQLRFGLTLHPQLFNETHSELPPSGFLHGVLHFQPFSTIALRSGVTVVPSQLKLLHKFLSIMMYFTCARLYRNVWYRWLLINATTLSLHLLHATSYQSFHLLNQVHSNVTDHCICVIYRRHLDLADSS